METYLVAVFIGELYFLTNTISFIIQSKRKTTYRGSYQRAQYIKRNIII